MGKFNDVGGMISTNGCMEGKDEGVRRRKRHRFPQCQRRPSNIVKGRVFL